MGVKFLRILEVQSAKILMVISSTILSNHILGNTVVEYTQMGGGRVHVTLSLLTPKVYREIE